MLQNYSSAKMKKSAFVDINEVPHLIITYGGWITDCSASEIVLVIPGNPGLIEYYDSFLANLFEDLGGKTPVWGISHGGHSLPQNMKDVPSIKAHTALYDLEGQTVCKLAFLARYAPASARLHLVGHSIGSQICLQLRRRLGPLRVASTYHLFPTVQKMRTSPAGRRLWRLSYVTRLILALAWLLSMLPLSVRRFLVGFWLPRDSPAEAHDATAALIHPQTLHAVIHMGRNELEVVRELDAETVQAAADTARFLFGQADPWVPLEYVDHLRKTVPKVDAVVCEEEYPHAFVLCTEAIGGCSRKVAEWVRRFWNGAAQDGACQEVPVALPNGDAGAMPPAAAVKA